MFSLYHRNRKVTIDERNYSQLLNIFLLLCNLYRNLLKLNIKRHTSLLYKNFIPPAASSHRDIETDYVSLILQILFCNIRIIVEHELRCPFSKLECLRTVVASCGIPRHPAGGLPRPLRVWRCRRTFLSLCNIHITKGYLIP